MVCLQGGWKRGLLADTFNWKRQPLFPNHSYTLSLSPPSPPRSRSRSDLLPPLEVSGRSPLPSSPPPSIQQGADQDRVLVMEIFAEAWRGRGNAMKGLEEDPAERKVPEAAGTIQEPRMREDNLEFKRNVGSPAHNDTHGRRTKPTVVVEKSPMQKHARTPGRAGLASSSRGDDHDKGVTVPKFGEWDESNPASGESFTQVFNLVREERQGITRSGTDPHVDSSHSSAARRANTSNSKGCCCCCCPWLGI